MALREFTGTTVEDLPRLRAAIDARRARHEELAAHAWTGPLIDEVRRAAPADPVMVTLKGLVAAVEQAETQRRNQVARAISVPDSAERDPAFREAVTRLSKGARAFLLPIGNAEQRKLLQQVTVSGGAPATPEDWSQVAAVLDWRDGLQRLVAQWSSLASELGLPTVPTGAAATVIRGLTSVAAVVRLAIESVHDHDRTLAQWIARLFQPTPETAPANSLHHLDRVVGSIEAHLEQAQVTYALDRRRAYVQRLEGCSGDLSRALTSLFGEALGGSMDEEALGRSWRALTEELRRRSQFVTALRTIRATVDLLANAGAPAWADRLRTQPADPASDVDPCLPHDWADAWMWRRHETFLQTIDAHQELRRLFGERERLARALASTYQELAAAKTWLAVSQHAGAEVRAALKGFLTAVLAMGRGTGKNAIMLRRDAKKAMAHAYRGVPCWILPHYRVSESLPAQIGLFDLVIVDEASQSDLSCMPAILRGKKLLVVGDDRQVSPSTVGVATETLADLRNRFLGFFPETIGPLMLPGRSIYDLANVVFAGEGVMLREHFRSVAPIIQWSNQHYYANKIVPLRVPTASERFASTWARRRKDCIDDLIATLLRIGVGPAPPTARPSLVASRVYAVESRIGEIAEEATSGIDRAGLQPLPLAVDAEGASHVSELGEVNGDVLVDIPAAGAGVHTPAGPLPTPVPAVGSADPATLASLADALLALLPSDGSSVGNVTLKRELEARGYRLSDEEYFHTRQELIDRGLCVTGRGRGGSLRRCDPQDEAESGEQEAALEIQRQRGTNGSHSTAAGRPKEDLVVAMLALIPSDGSSIGNGSLRRELELRGHALSDEEYFAARQVLIDRGHCERGMGRGGSVRRVERQARLI